jgi:acetolactate synthase regulatory subunit
MVKLKKRSGLGFSSARSPRHSITQSQSLERETAMQVFHIRYRNAQGALMRILNAISRRGLDLTSVHADAAGQDHAVTVLLEVTHKQSGQLCREWSSIVDVVDVRSSAASLEHGHPAWTPLPPGSARVSEHSARAALA